MPINFSSPTTIGGTTLLKTRIGEPMLGEIVRVLNSGSTTATYSFTDIYDEPATLTLTPGTKIYNLEKSGSAVDIGCNISVDSIILYTTKLLITGSSLENNFTEELITTPGAGTWTKPTGVTEVIVECWGGGGAGGGCTATNSGAAGGASGGYARKLIKYSSPSQNISYSVAEAVAGTTGAGANGNDTTWNTTEVVAKGGGGGDAGVNGSNVIGASPLSPNVGDVTVLGEPGGNGGYTPPNFEAAFGGSAGFGPDVSQDLDLFDYSEYIGIADSGTFITTGGVNGIGPTAYCSGGSGAAKISGANRVGGNGGQGLIRLIYR